MVLKKAVSLVVSFAVMLTISSCKKDEELKNEDVAFNFFGSVSKDYIINYNFYPNLTIYDCNTHNQTVFCGLPGCMHENDNKDCQAYSFGEFACVFIRNGYTYYFDTDELITKIYKADSSGSGRKTITEIDGKTTDFKMYNNRLYFVSQITETIYDEEGNSNDVMKTNAINYFDFKSDKVVTVIKCEKAKQALINSYFINGDKIAYYISYYNDDNSYGGIEYIYDTKYETSNVFSNNVDYVYFGMYENDIYYVSKKIDERATAIYKYNIDTQKSELIKEKKIGYFNIIENYLIYQEKYDSKECTVINLDNNEVKQVNLSDKSVIPEFYADGYVFGEYNNVKTSGNIIRMSFEDFESGAWDKYITTPGVENGVYQY